MHIIVVAFCRLIINNPGGLFIYKGGGSVIGGY